MDFMWFTGFDVSDSVPDETSICRFRNRLVAKGLDKVLFAELNRQLVAIQKMIQKTSGDKLVYVQRSRKACSGCP